MPLIKSASRAAISQNIRTEMNEGKKPQRQAIAIALDVARRAKRDAGGAASSTPWYIRHESNLINRPGASISGAMPKIAPLTIKGNLASSTPVGQALASSAKVGSVKPNFPKLPNPPKLPKMKAGGEVEKERNEPLSSGPIVGNTPGRADKVNTKVANNSFIVPAHVVSALGEGNTMAGMAKLNKMFPSEGAKRAKGGKSGDHVDVALSDGEFSIGPEHVMKFGGGDMAKGHRLLKMACEHITNKTAEKLKHMPTPVSDPED